MRQLSAHAGLEVRQQVELAAVVHPMVDAIGPVMGGTVSVLVLLGGTWFSLTSGVMHDIGRRLPSYWLVQASRVSVGGQGWGTHGWLVVTSVVLTVLAAHANLRDTKPV